MDIVVSVFKNRIFSILNFKILHMKRSLHCFSKYFSYLTLTWFEVICCLWRFGSDQAARCALPYLQSPHASFLSDTSLSDQIASQILVSLIGIFVGNLKWLHLLYFFLSLHLWLLNLFRKYWTVSVFQISIRDESKSLVQATDWSTVHRLVCACVNPYKAFPCSYLKGTPWWKHLPVDPPGES